MAEKSNSQSKSKSFLSVREAAEELGKSERSGWRLVEQGELPVHEFGGSTRVKRDDLDAYIARSRRPIRPSDEDKSEDDTSSN